MSKRYRIFVGAPSKQDLAVSSGSSSTWRTLTTTNVRNPAVDITLPPSTLEAAHLRISTFYSRAIFGSQEAEPEEGFDEHTSEEDAEQGQLNMSKY